MERKHCQKKKFWNKGMIETKRAILDIEIKI